MRRSAAVLAFALVVNVPGLSAAAWAHGGGYKGPPGEVPGDPRTPSDPPPPPEGGDPQTPSGEPGGPETGPGGSPGGPQTPSGGTPGPGTPSGGGNGPQSGGGTPGGPSTSGGRAPGAKSAVMSDWPWWWGNNKDEILQLKSAVLGMRRSPYSRGVARRGSVLTVTDEAIEKRIVPALRALLADESASYHIRSAAEIALAKIGDRTIVPTLERLGSNGSGVHREIRESAALSLGLLQRPDEDTFAFLGGIVRDGTNGGSFARPFAAISIGLLSDGEHADAGAAAALLDVVARREAGADVKPACLMALGFSGDLAVATELLAIIRTGHASASGAEALDETSLSFAVAALGRIGRPGLQRPGEETCIADEVLRLSEDRSRAGLDVRRSATIALGRIAPRCPVRLQRKLVGSLDELSSSGSDEQQRHFALMSLGRIGSSRDADPACRKQVLEVLGRTLEKGRGLDKPFAAMALGLVGRAYLDEGRPALEEEVRAPLLAKFDEGGDPRMRGAYALASGLARNPLAVPSLLAALTDRKEDRHVRGWCALALGMIGAREATDAIRAALSDDDREMRVQAATAAGLLQDGTVEEDLVKVIRDKEASNYELGSAASALGIIGDEHAIEPLLELAMDRENRYPVLTRALAVVALGQIGDRREVPTLAKVGTDVNYRARVPAITELLTIL